MLNLFTQLPLFLAQAYGRGTYNSLKYQDTTNLGPFTLPSVGAAGMAIASFLALCAGIIVFLVTKKRHGHENQKDT